jgi:hypothetical protein
MSKNLIQVSHNFLKNTATKFLTRKVKPFAADSPKEYTPADLVIVRKAEVKYSSEFESGFGCSRIVVGRPTCTAPAKALWRKMRFEISEFVDSESGKIVPDGVLMIFSPEGSFYVSELPATSSKKE